MEGSDLRIFVFGAKPDAWHEMNRRLIKCGFSPDFLQGKSLSAVFAAVNCGAMRLNPVMLADGPGIIASIREARDAGITSPFIVMRDGIRKSVSEYLDAGADEVLSFNMLDDEIGARLRAVMRRSSAVPQFRVETGDLVIPLDGSPPEISGMPVELTAREHEILLAIARSAGRVVPKEAIYDALYSVGDSTPFEQVLDVHIFNIRKKMSRVAGRKFPVIRTLRGRGYIIDGQKAGARA